MSSVSSEHALELLWSRTEEKQATVAKGLPRGSLEEPMQCGDSLSLDRGPFSATCRQLCEAERFRDLLVAIESSKGRLLADKLTHRRDDVLSDEAIQRCIEDLPALTEREGFHYLTYCVDEECLYVVLISKRGEIHGIPPVGIKSSEPLRQLAAALAALLEKGVLEEGDHICYSPDDDFYNVPLHLLRLGDGIVLDRFSVSRVPAAVQLDQVLARDTGGAASRYVGFLVPALEDLEGEEGEWTLANLEAPMQWLGAYGVTGETIRCEDATPERVKRESLARAVVHFSVYAGVPYRGNPLSESCLLLAGKDGLPAKEAAARGEHDGTLSPRDILDAGLDLDGSHISMMACLAGPARGGTADENLGLDCALIRSGASSLIVTHWEISAECAAAFFEGFYRRWLGEGWTRAGAWRDTMLELLDDDRSPDSLYKWGAFSLTGDFR